MAAHQIDLPLTVSTGAAPSLDPRQTIEAWVARRHDLLALKQSLMTIGWHDGVLEPGNRQLTITGPSGIRVTLWQGMDHELWWVQLSIGWLGVLGLMNGPETRAAGNAVNQWARSRHQT